MIINLYDEENEDIVFDEAGSMLYTDEIEEEEQEEVDDEYSDVFGSSFDEEEEEQDETDEYSEEYEEFGNAIEEEEEPDPEIYAKKYTKHTGNITEKLLDSELQKLEPYRSILTIELDGKKKKCVVLHRIGKSSRFVFNMLPEKQVRIIDISLL